MPIRTLQRRLAGNQMVSSLMVSASPGASTDAIKSRIELLMRERRRITEDKEDDFNVLDTKEIAGSDEFHVYGGFCAKNREFVDCLKSGELPGSHFGDAVKTMELAETILAQGILG